MLSWRPVHKGNVRGFCDVLLPIGLEIREIMVLANDKDTWTMLPTRPQFDQEGRHKIGSDAKAVYDKLLVWRSQKLREAFSGRIVELVRARYPSDL